MTREEAIKRFKGIRESFSISIAQSKFYPSKAELDELCNIAIEALSAKFTGDLISRADVKAEATKFFGHWVVFENRIDKIPLAEVAHGKWIIRENGNKECSLCGHEKQDGWDYFCGYCGADMRGGVK